MKIGILFGGPSREREVAFAGGRTVYDNLDKELFEPIPIFVDSRQQFILLDWSYIYKGSIRDFYPPLHYLPDSPHEFQIYDESLGPLSDEKAQNMAGEIGRPIQPSELPNLIDFAFLALHGKFGEDGAVQGLLQSLNISYSGSGILPSALGISKAHQKKMMRQAPFDLPNSLVIKRDDWVTSPDRHGVLDVLDANFDPPFVIRPSNQGSSIGVSIVKDKNHKSLSEAINKAFFVKTIDPKDWVGLSEENKVQYIRHLCDIREGLGLPLRADGEILSHPEELFRHLDKWFTEAEEPIFLEALDIEKEVVVEEFINGKEFSCIVIRDQNGKPLPLPPTEIVKGEEVYDYASKYLPGYSRKVTPIRLPAKKVKDIQNICRRLFQFFGFHVYARIDGFINDEGVIYLNDPNTTSGMLPSSFFFHQAAELGLNPSQFLTYIIRTSLAERMDDGYFYEGAGRYLEHLDLRIHQVQQQARNKKKVAILLGGFSTERHISVESGRNIYEKLSSSDQYKPVPIFVTGDAEHHELYRLPINILLKDNADDIKEKVENFSQNPVMEEMKRKNRDLIDKYVGTALVDHPQSLTYEELAGQVDAVFIALHGRPGEDGAVQQILEQYGVPYNGSGVASSLVTINKYETKERLREHGLTVADQREIRKDEWLKKDDKLLEEVAGALPFPFIAKPVDEGCSAAVKKITNKEQLAAYCELLFRDEANLPEKAAATLHIGLKEEIPRKDAVLIEQLIQRNGAQKLLEITCGLLTHYDENGELVYEMFEPSETLAEDDILSLEEKFLAGQGQNITPARFSKNDDENRQITDKVKDDLRRAAQILGIEGYCRFDAFVRIYQDMSVETIIIEVNSLPGMTPATAIFHQAAINGYRPYDLIDQIITFSIKKQQLAAH